METIKQVRNVLQLLRNPHIWIIISVSILLGIIYYADYFHLTDWFPVGKKFFTRSYPHDLYRALFFVPLLYTAFKFRVRGAAIASFILWCILLPYSIALSTNDDPLLRAIVFSIVASIATLILGYAREQSILASRQRDLTLAILQGSDDAIINETLDGVITVWSYGAERIYGYSADEAIGKHISMLASPAYVNGPRELLERLKRGEHIDHFETKRLTKDGREIYVSLNTSPVRDMEGNITGFSAIGRDITEQKHAEENLQTYAELITEAQEEERKRIARELHDDTAQELASLALDMDLLISKPENLSKENIDSLEKFRDKVVSIQTGVRRFSQDLRPSLLNDFGLLVALRWMTEGITRNYVIDTSVELSGTSRRLSPNTELVLYRIAQEALSNARKHSKANKVVIKLAFSPEKMRMAVIDDGQGFDIPEEISSFVPMGKLGLLGMHERVRLINATLEMKSETGKGTTISVEVKE